MISQFSVHQLSGQCSAAVPAASAGRMPALREGALSSHFLDTTLGYHIKHKLSRVFFEASRYEHAS